MVTSVALVNPTRTPRNDNVALINVGNGPVASNRINQQPEDGLWCEYGDYEVVNGTVVNASWSSIHVNWINASHYNVTEIRLYDNNTMAHNGWFVVNNVSGFVEQVFNYWPLIGSKNSLIAPNGSTVGMLIGPYMLYSSSAMYNITSIDWSAQWSEYLLVARGLGTASNVTAKYLQNSGLLVYVYANNTHVGDLLPSYQSMELCRTNIDNIGNYIPPLPSYEPWLRYDITSINRTSGTMTPLMSEFLKMNWLSSTSYEASLDIVASFGSNGSFGRMSFIMASDTIERLLYGDQHAPFPFNETGTTMGLDVLYYDTSWLHTGQIVPMSVSPFGSQNPIIIPTEVGSQMPFRGYNCWVLREMIGARVKAAFFIEAATGIILREQIGDGNTTIIIELVSSNWFQASYSINQPQIGSWMDMGGFTMTQGNASHKVPAYFHSSFSPISQEYFNATSTWTISENGTLLSARDEVTIENATSNMWNSTNPEAVWGPLNSTVGFNGKALLIPNSVELGTILHTSSGLGSYGAGEVIDVNAMRDGIACIRVRVLMDSGSGSPLNSTLWFDKATGMIYEMEGGYGSLLVMYMKRMRDSMTMNLQNPQPLDDGWVYNIGYTFNYYSNTSSWEYQAMTQTWSIERLGDLSYNMTLALNNYWADTGDVDRMTGDLRVMNSTNWVVASQIPWWSAAPNASIIAFNPFFIHVNGISVGKWVPVAFGPYPLAICNVVGTETIDSVNCWKLVPVASVHDTLNVTAYYSIATGMMVQMNGTMPDTYLFFRTVLNNLTAPLPLKGITEGEWVESAGYYQQNITTIETTSSTFPMLGYASIHNNTDGTFNMTNSGMIVPGSNRTTYQDRVDLATMEIWETTAPWVISSPLNGSGYYGHSNYMLPRPTQIGSVYLINMGPQFDVPLIVTGTAVHHGRQVWVLRLHEYYAYFYNSSTSEYYDTEFWYYQDDGRMANFNLYSRNIFGLDVYESTIRMNALYSSRDANPNPIYNNFWADYLMDLRYNSTIDNGTMPLSFEMIQTSPNNYTSNMVGFQEDGPFFWRFMADNRSRFVYSMNGSNPDLPLYNQVIVTNFLQIPLTLEIGDYYYLTSPSDSMSATRVIDTRLFSSWLGVRNAHVLRAIDGSLVAAYDTATGILVSMNISSMEGSSLFERFIHITNTNLLNPLQCINYTTGLVANYTGYSIEYTPYGMFADTIGINTRVLSNNGTASIVLVQMSMGNSGWVRFLYRNNRLFWIDAIDPALAPSMQPNYTGAFNGFNGMVLYPTVAIGDYYAVQFGPMPELLHVVNTGVIFSGTMCIQLADDTGLVNAYYRQSDKMLVYYMVANKSVQVNRTKIIEMWNVALYTHPITADFSVNDTSPNLGRVTQFIDQSTNTDGGSFNYTVWAWDDYHGRGNYSGPVFNFLATRTGLHKFTLIAGTTTGHFNVKTVYYNVTLAPVAAFVANVTTIAPGDLIRFSFTGSGGDLPATLSWNFGDGTPIFNATNPVHQYTILGVHFVTLTVTDYYGEVDQHTMPINVTNADLFPIAAFTANVTQAHINDDIQFTFTGFPGNTPATYQWYFGDGTANSTVQNPVHRYSMNVTYDVTLTVRDADGDISVLKRTGYIHVVNNLLPVANFTASPTTVLQGMNVSFTFTGFQGDSPVAFQWDFGDSSPFSNGTNPSHRYQIPGVYTAILVVTDGNSDVDGHLDTIIVIVDYTPNATFTSIPATIIEGQSIMFNHTGISGNLPATYRWRYGNGTIIATSENVTKQFNLAGTFTVELMVMDSDGDIATFSSPTLTVFPDLPLSAAFVNASARTIVAGQSVSFTHTGGNGNPPATYQWYFGDSTANDTNEHPIHLFNTAGIFDVTLTIWDVDGDFNTVVQTGYVTVLADIAPSATFVNATSRTIVAGQSVSFTHTGSNGNLPAMYQWYFGDGTLNATVEHPTHVFATAGTFAVTLTIRDTNGDLDTVVQAGYITVLSDVNPSAAFVNASVRAIIAGQSVSFTHTGSNGNLPATYQWYFGDSTGNVSIEHPTHVFATAGTFTVTLTIQDTDGDHDTFVQISYISVATDLAPSAAFTNTTSRTIIAGQTVTLTHTGSNGNLPATYQWYFGDSTANDTNEHPIHLFNTAGIFDVTLTIWDVDGDFNTVVQTGYVTVLVDIAPSATFVNATSRTIVAGQSVSFTHTGSNGNPPATYQWYFGDSTANVSVEHPTHVFATAGTFAVTLTIQDVDGDRHTFVQTSYISVVVDLTPSAAFVNATSRTIVAGQSVSFTHTGSNGNPPATYQWFFGDSTTNATAENPTHFFTTAGTFTITLTIQDTDGDHDTFMQTSYISVATDPTPSAAFTNATSRTIVAGQSVSFTHTGSNGNLPATYEWYFGDSTGNATVEHPTHTFATAGTFTVTLTIRDTDGDFDKVVQINYITVASDLTPSAAFTNATSRTIIAGQSVSFTHVGSNGNLPATYQWNFGDVPANETVEHPTHAFATAGTFTVTLTIRDTDGDFDKVVQTNYITVAMDLAPSAAFTNASARTIVAGQSVSFTHVSSNGNLPATYQWNFGDVPANETVEHPTHAFATAGMFTVTLTICDIDGDFNTVVQAGYVTVANDLAPSAAFVNASARSIVAGQSVSFTHTGSNGNMQATYEWYFGDGTLNATVEHPTHVFATAGTFAVTLTIHDVDGDHDTFVQTSYISVIADLAPSAAFTNATSRTIVAGQSVSFTHAGGNGNLPATYEWYFGDGILNVTAEHPTHIFATAGTFAVTLTIRDTDGDQDTIVQAGYVVVFADIAPSAAFTNATSRTIIAGQSVSFAHTGGNGNLPVTYQWYFGDGTANATAENPTHVFATAGSFTVRLTVQDVDGDADTVVQISYVTVTTGGEGPSDDQMFLIILFIALIAGVLAITGAASARSNKKKAALKTRKGEKGKKSAPLYQEPTKTVVQAQIQQNMPPVGAKLPTGDIAAKKMKASAVTEEVVPRASPEEMQQLETEMKVDLNVDKCLICKKELSGDVFICPQCKIAKYHHQCVEHLIESNEPCWNCQKPILSPDSKKEIESLQLKLQYIQKNMEDLSDRFRKREITQDAFFDAYNQFKKDKEEIEKQLKIRTS